MKTRHPSTGSSVDFLYTDDPICRYCGDRLRNGEDQFEKWFCLHNDKECYITVIRQSVRDIIEALTK